jgi:putative transposase
MNKGAARTLINPAHCELEKWQIPNPIVLSKADTAIYEKRKEAVEMYSESVSYKEIHAYTGISKSEVRRLIQRCLTYDGNGKIYGFSALVPRIRIGEYVRKAPVEHIRGGDSSGCAGAFEDLLRRFPEVDHRIQSLFFKEPNGIAVHEARIPIVDIHKNMIQMLRELKFSDTDWPFNTSNVGYKSLVKYCKRLREHHADRAMLARSGKDASRRMAIGNGYYRFLPMLRHYSYLLLDFHVVDAASTIVVTNAHGVELDIPVSRWYFGAICCDSSHAVVGLYIALERTPTADCALETVNSALTPEKFIANDPKWRYVQDGKVLIHQLIPELEWQGFSALMVDNAWSNAANDVVNNIIDTIGCAVNFGPSRQWWRRHLIEKIFGELTRRGLQRLPSTHGSGPGDTKKDNPNQQAIRFKIRLTEIIALIYPHVLEHNVEQTESLQFASPVDVLKSALDHPASGFYSSPLPKNTQKNPTLLQHMEEVTVRGNIEKGKRPYFVSDRCEYRNDKLARSFHLIGKKLIAYIYRRDCRIVHASIKETGENLGPMSPEFRWSQVRCSWRLRKLINRSGFAKKYWWNHTMGAVSQWSVEKYELLAKRRTKAPQSKNTAPSSDALILAKTVISANQQVADFSSNAQIASPALPDPAPCLLPPLDPFGLSEVPAD